ncbi:hypothetical protein [Streptomyces luteireticuli]|uniref:Uncharacterized protein n=1 Tax=Streptomyces luteireticuli TaxID=173858 RepID=A0ABN0Z0L4_9ACTN
MTDATRRTVRTLVQTTVAIAALLPVLVDAAGLPTALPWVAGSLAVAAGLTRLMAVPGLQALLPAWLRTHSPDDRLPALTARPEDA